MSAPFHTSPVSDELHDAVFALHEQLFRAHIEQLWGWHPDWQRQNFRHNWKTCETQVIQSGDHLIGYLQVFREPGHLQLKNLGLLPAWQGRGIGTELVRQIQAQAETLQLPIQLSVFTTNHRAQRFYERAGFINDDRTAEFQHMRWSPPSAPSSAA